MVSAISQITRRVCCFRLASYCYSLFLLLLLLVDVWVIYLCFLGLRTFLWPKGQLAGTDMVTFVVGFSGNVHARVSVAAIGL